MTPGPAPDYRFEIALSFPSQYDDSVVKPVAKVLAKHFGANGRDKILYDHWLKDIPGRADLEDYLTNLFKNQSRLLVFFLCQEYESSTWCGMEWRVFKHLLKERQQDRLMLLGLDDGDYPRLLSIDYATPIKNLRPSEIAKMILGRWESVPRPRIAPPAIDKIVDQVRTHTRDRTLNECGTIKILGMPKPVPVQDLYIDVRILEKRSRDKALTQAQLAERRGIDPALALGIDEQGERVDGLKVFDRSKR